MDLSDFLFDLISKELKKSKSLVEIANKKINKKLLLNKGLAKELTNILNEDISVAELLDVSKFKTDIPRAELSALSNSLNLVLKATKSTARRTNILGALQLIDKINEVKIPHLDSMPNNLKVDASSTESINITSNKAKAIYTYETVSNIDKFLSSKISEKLRGKVFISKPVKAKLFKGFSSKIKKASIISEFHNTKSKKLRTKKTSKTSKRLAIKRDKTSIFPKVHAESGTSIKSILKKLSDTNLHNELRNVMGDPSDAPVRLRYQTGRFAKSTHVISASITRTNMVSIKYSYLRAPYDVFLPSGKLYKPQRNPKFLIATSIRNLISKDIKIRTTLV